jgi:PAS domain S-box-containing protein
MPSEIERARYLHREMQRQGIDIDAFLEPGYNAVVLHSNSTIFAGNLEAARILGCERNELIGLNSWKLFPAEFASTLMQNLMQQSEQPYQVNLRDLQGRIFPIELKGRNFEMAGESVRVVLVKLMPDAEVGESTAM